MGQTFNVLTSLFCAVFCTLSRCNMKEAIVMYWKQVDVRVSLDLFFFNPIRFIRVVRSPYWRSELCVKKKTQYTLLRKCLICSAINTRTPMTSEVMHTTTSLLWKLKSDAKERIWRICSIMLINPVALGRNLSKALFPMMQCMTQPNTSTMHIHYECLSSLCDAQKAFLL